MAPGRAGSHGTSVLERAGQLSGVVRPRGLPLTMFAILPPDLHPEPTFLLVALLLGSLVLLPLVLTQKGHRAPLRVCFGGIGFVSLSILTVSCLSPSVARVERLYHQGHDQFYWG